MSDLAALLSACRADPADDLPRLVLADWLDEHGDPDRALFVRVQCELARPTADAARAADLRAVERDLLAANGGAWLGDLPAVFALLRDRRAARHWEDVEAVRGRHGRAPRDRPAVPPAPPDPLSPHNEWRFERGLLTARVAAVELAAEPLVGWLRTPPADWLEVVHVVLVGLDTFERLTLPPELGGRVGVDVVPGGEPVDIARWERFVAGPTFAALRGLRLDPAAAAADHLRALAAADTRRITALDLSHCGLTDAGLELVLAGRWDGLSALSAEGNHLGPAAGRLLADRPPPRLARLTAFRNRLGDDGLAAVVGSPLADTLTTLWVQNNHVGCRGVRALVDSGLLARLAGPGLNLSMNAVADAGARALADCPHLARFRELVLRDNRVGDAGAEALAASPFAANLAYLDLWRNRVGDRGAAALAWSDPLARVRDLNLRENRLTPVGAAALRRRLGDRAKT